MLTDVVIANKSYTRLNVTEGKVVDNIALMVMKQDCPDFLLPLKTIEIDGELELRYELLEGIRLCYSNMKMRKNEFTVLLKNMLLPFKTCNDWFLDYHNILMDADYIMVGKNGQMIRYIYIPVAEYAHSDREIIDFFCDMVLKAEIEDDPRYTVNLLRVLKADNANLITLLDYISKEEHSGVQDTVMSGNPVTANHPQEVQPFKPAADSGINFNSPFKKPIEDVRGGAQKSQKMQAEASGIESETVNGGNTADAARPGQMPQEFGRQDIESKLLGNLFGDEEDDAQTKKKRRKDKVSKQSDEGKEAKERKEKKEKKEKKEGGLFFFKGNAKGEKQQDMAANANRGTASAAKPSETYSGAGNGIAQNGWQGQGGYTGEDATEIDQDEDISDSNMIRLSLENGAGFHCPQYIEINLQKGFATLGRYDKNGQAQADFNFDASLSFISRVHLRIEKVGDQWQIIDLNSHNGTFVNGEALVPNIAYPLRPNDRIMISAKNRLTYQVC